MNAGIYERGKNQKDFPLSFFVSLHISFKKTVFRGVSEHAHPEISLKSKGGGVFVAIPPPA